MLVTEISTRERGGPDKGETGAVIETNVCILGAGPAGATAALFLAKHGVDCILVDKAIFPRDKVCGDALSGKVVDILDRIDPELVPKLGLLENSLESWGITLVAPNGQALKLPFPDSRSKAPGYTLARLDFDNFLVQEAADRHQVKFLPGKELDPIESDKDGILLSDKKGGLRIKAKLTIVANGAYSSFTRRWAGIPMEMRHYGAGVSAYYENVEGFDPNGYVELHFLEPLLPGYFWVFPLPNGQANAGIYTRSDVISKRGISLRNRLNHTIDNHPVIRKRFASARRISDIRGFGLPLGSKSRTLSGDNYLLVGDAAHLIDPFTGEGIGNAMLSGMLAARQAVECLEKQDFSRDILKGYDQELRNHLGQEFRISNWVQRLSGSAYLWNLVVRIANSDPKIRDLLSRMLSDGSLREKLVDPMAYWKLARKKWRLLLSN